MSDPPSPLSPLNQTPNSPTPKAAHPRTFWRDIVRRVSRSTVNLPNLESSITPPPLEPPTKLVEINPTVRQHTDAIRKPQNDPVKTSAFDDLPPAEAYDPAWYNNPLRGEAGRLGCVTGPTAPLLPGAFTIKSSDLDDDDDDDDDDGDDDDDDDNHPDDHSQHTHHETLNHPSDPPQLDQNTLPETSSTATPIPDRHRVPPIANTPAAHQERQPRESERSIRSRRSLTWRKQTPAKAPPPQTPVKSRSTQRKPSTFDTPCTQEKTTQLLTTALNLLRADFMAFKQNEVRARVPVTAKDQTVVQVVVVISLDQRPASCRVSVRKSFADSFRLSSEEFDCFCSDLQKTFRELQHADSS